jgi:lipoyl-dependent peroxiredoxin
MWGTLRRWIPRSAGTSSTVREDEGGGRSRPEPPPPTGSPARPADEQPDPPAPAPAATGGSRPATLIQTLYQASATALGGREGRTASDDGRLDLTISVPASIGGPGTGTNPEQLFAAGFASCFHSALQIVARKHGHSPEGSAVTARVSLGRIQGSIGYGLAVHLAVALPEVDRADTLALVKQADEVCPYANAVRGNISLTFELT